MTRVCPFSAPFSKIKNAVTPVNAEITAFIDSIVAFATNIIGRRTPASQVNFSRNGANKTLCRKLFWILARPFNKELRVAQKGREVLDVSLKPLLIPVGKLVQKQGAQPRRKE